MTPIHKAFTPGGIGCHNMMLPHAPDARGFGSRQQSQVSRSS